MLYSDLYNKIIIDDGFLTIALSISMQSLIYIYFFLPIHFFKSESMESLALFKSRKKGTEMVFLTSH